MVNSVKKNTARVAKTTKPILSVDWTSAAGAIPFFVHETDILPAHYAVAVETDVSVKSSGFNPENYKELGVEKILRHYNKNTIDNRTRSLIVAHIPQGASGSYVPLRPLEKIKVLVTIPEKDNNISPPFIFDNLPAEVRQKPAPFDEIQLNSFDLRNRANKIAKILEKFGQETNNFEGRVYNINLNKEANRVRSFVSTLSNFIEKNGFSYSDMESDLIMIGISGSGPGSSEYRPIYAQINKGDGFNDLPIGFDAFRESNFATSNTMYIYKNFSNIEERINSQLSSSFGWEEFLNRYIHFPPAVVKHSNPRPESFVVTHTIRDVMRGAKEKPVKTQEELDKETWRIKSRKFKKEMDAYLKTSKNFIGDNVIGNLNNIIYQIDTAEAAYEEALDKLGIRYIVKQAMRCTGLELPLEEIKAFIRDVNDFAEQVIAILEIPTLSLDDLIPTVDITWDVGEQILLAIAESVKIAVIEMVKQIIEQLIANCGDPSVFSKTNYGGIPIVGALAEAHKTGDLSFMNTVGILGDEVGLGAAVQSGISATSNMSANSKEFLGNLNSFIDNETLQQLASENFAPLQQVMEQISSVLTPGEIARLLQGKASGPVVKIISTIATDAESDSQFIVPQAATAIKKLLDSQEKIEDFFLNMGKTINEEEILKQIEGFEEIVPGMEYGLCDLDDSLLRQSLLSDKGLGSVEAQEQIEASRSRARTRINELSNILEKGDDIFADAIPPPYCTYKDGKTLPGLIEDHSSFTFMMKTTLDTVFGGISNAFDEDISRVPNLMKADVPGEEIINRTIEGRGPGSAFIDGKHWKMNPKFEMAVQEGFQPNPPYWKAPILDSGDNPTSDPSFRDIERAQGLTIQWNRARDLEGKQLKKPTTNLTYMPGLSGPNGAYANFETSLAHGSLSELKSHNQNARKSLNADRKILQFSPENQAGDLLRSQIGGRTMAKITIELLKQHPSLSKLNLSGSKYALLCALFEDAQPGKDKFSILIKEGGTSIYRHLYNSDIKPSASHVIQNRNLKSDFAGPDYSTKESHFAHFLQKIWSAGENIYTTDLNSPIVKPSYSKGFLTLPDETVALALMGDQGSSASDNVKSLFEELRRDLMASCLAHVGKSKLLADSGKIFDLLNFNPSCPDPGLLALEDIKQEVLKVYKEIQCFELSLPNVTGLGDNRNNAIEQSTLYGVIKATVRTYAMEAALKCLITFSQLMVVDVDEVFIGYIRDKIMREIKGKKYLDVFMDETLKAYNNVTRLSETDSAIALDWFIKGEFKYAINVLLTVAGVDKADKHIDNFALNNNQTGLIPEFNALGSLEMTEGPAVFAQRINEDNNLRGRYHVANAKEIRGIKDWRNGNFYLEKYIRADIDYSSDDAKEEFDFIDKADYPEYPGSSVASDVPEHEAADQGRFEGITCTAQFPTWFYHHFKDYDPGSTKSTKTVDIPGDPECNPSDINLSFDTFTKKKGSLGLYYKNLRYGLRLVCQVTQDNMPAGGGLSGLYPNNTYRALAGAMPGTGVGAPPQSTKTKLNKSYYIREKTLAPVPQDVGAFTFPIACVEEDIPLDTSIEDIINSFGDDSENPNNFFSQGYTNAYYELVKKLKKTNEWSFIFDYCFPTKRMVSLAALYNITYLFPFPGLDTVFTNTKEQLRISFLSILHSGNYQYIDPDWTQRNLNQAGINQEISGLDISLMAKKFLLALLKGAAETFSPNIAIAKRIKSAAEMAAEAAYQYGEDAIEFLEKEVGLRLSDPKPPAPCPPPDIPWKLDLPIFPISLGLAPGDIFWGSPMPPLTDLGLLYLIFFGASSAPGSVLLKTEEKKEIERCETGDGNLNQVCPDGKGSVRKSAGIIEPWEFSEPTSDEAVKATTEVVGHTQSEAPNRDDLKTGITVSPVPVVLPFPEGDEGG